MKTVKILSIILVFFMIITGCKKNLINGAHMKVNLTDAPANYESVFIDLQKVMVHYERSPEDKWIELRSNPGIYDLLTLRNNVNLMIAEGEKLPLGKISQIRLVLGENNSVVVAGVGYGLKIPSSATSGLKINVHETLRSNDDIIITLDFDAESSVKLKGNGEYSMEPVIRVKEIVNN